MFPRTRLIPTVFSALCLMAPSLAARQQPTQTVQQPPFEPKLGMPGKDAVWVPTHPAVLEKMLDIAKVTANDVVVDLDRRWPDRHRRGQTWREGDLFRIQPRPGGAVPKTREGGRVAGKATFVEGDMYAAEFPDATVLALFLLPSNLEKLKDKILALKPGTRIVVNTFTVPGWEPDERSDVAGECTTWCDVLLHIVPAKVAGAWRGEGIQLDFSQSFQKVFGTVTPAARPR